MEKGGLNLYGFVRNNSINLWDVLGEEPGHDPTYYGETVVVLEWLGGGNYDYVTYRAVRLADMNHQENGSADDDLIWVRDESGNRDAPTRGMPEPGGNSSGGSGASISIGGGLGGGPFGFPIATITIPFIPIVGSSPTTGPTAPPPTIFGIVYANHPVIPGIAHSKLVITPTDQARYANDPRFQNIDANGNHYAALGAGPDGTNAGGPANRQRGKLLAGVNRPRDVTQPRNNAQLLAVPGAYADEDAAIAALFHLLANYQAHQPLDYTLLPVGSGSYNSNSFISGLMAAGGFTLPNPPGGVVPGFGNPVPGSYFRSVPSPKPRRRRKIKRARRSVLIVAAY